MEQGEEFFHQMKAKLCVYQVIDVGSLKDKYLTCVIIQLMKDLIINTVLDYYNETKPPRLLRLTNFKPTNALFPKREKKERGEERRGIHVYIYTQGPNAISKPSY